MNKDIKKYWLVLMIISITGSGFCVADQEIVFKRKHRSTIENFPLKSIDQEEMSAAVIEGGLQAKSRSKNNNNEAVPAYAEQLDEESRVAQGDILTNESDDELTRAAQTFEPPPVVITPEIRAPMPTNVTYPSGAPDIQMQERP